VLCVIAEFCFSSDLLVTRDALPFYKATSICSGAYSGPHRRDLRARRAEHPAAALKAHGLLGMALGPWPC